MDSTVDHLPRPGAALLAVSAVLFALVILVPDPYLAYATDISAGLLMLVAGAWLAIGVDRHRLSAR